MHRVHVLIIVRVGHPYHISTDPEAKVDPCGLGVELDDTPVLQLVLLVV